MLIDSNTLATSAMRLSVSAGSTTSAPLTHLLQSGRGSARSVTCSRKLIRHAIAIPRKTRIAGLVTSRRNGMSSVAPRAVLLCQRRWPIVCAAPMSVDRLFRFGRYRLVVIDGRQAYQHARIDEEIFAKLHRASVVVADITGSRPNCFLELGYALGRCLPTIVTARSGSKLPFDIATLAGLHWKTDGTAEDRRRAFREHWNAVRNRPPLVKVEGLIP